MEYHESVDYLKSLQRHRPKLGTETTARMLSHLGGPYESVDYVQIAGSNGKGSTARMLESVLGTAGLDVGLFTSPRLNDLREQVRVNGRKIAKAQLADHVERIDPCIDRLRADDDEPTHFEVLAALAIHHFAVADVDVGILEVGIGGRYDATSAVDPVASAVTSVSLEHTDLLGDTVEEIARDKAQVAPADRPLVTGTTGAALEAVRAETDVITVGPDDADVVAVETGMRSDVENEVAISGRGWSLETNLALLGQHQATNAGVATALARQLADVDTATIAEGLRSATWPGRFEIMSRDPMVVLDGSHNPGACATVDELVGRYEYDDLHVVFGAMTDKDHDRMVEALPTPDAAYVTRPNVDRAESVDALAATFEGHADRIRRIESVQEATAQALAAADDSDFVLVTGSLYAVAEARDRWTRLVIPKDDARRASHRGAFVGAKFDEADAADLDHRVLATYLRPDQAELVDRRLAAAGGECKRGAVGAPGTFVSTVLSGTVPQLEELAASLADEDLGLGHVGRQLEAALEGPSAASGAAEDGPAMDGRVVDAEQTTDGGADGVELSAAVDGVGRTGGAGSTAIDWTEGGTAVMGVLNVTPDSFYDGGEYDDLDAALSQARRMADAGADVVDVGGESTRPGADPVPVEEEIARVVPVVEELAGLDVAVSVDTRRAEVAEAALAAGADVVNDVSGLSDPEMRFVVAEHDASLVLMHSVSAPVDPTSDPSYDDVVEDVLFELGEQVLLAERAGIDRERIVVDPGCGFGKDARESFELVDRLGEFRALGCPVMVGHSRKSMFAEIADRPGDRLPPTLGVTALAAERGADVVRVHDVPENAAVLRTVAATNGD